MRSTRSMGKQISALQQSGDGDLLVILVDKGVAGLAEVTGSPYVSRAQVWDNGIFPHRIPIRFTNVMLPQQRPPILGPLRDALVAAWGPTYGWGIINQQLVPPTSAEVIIEGIYQLPNDREAIAANLETLLANARVQRDQMLKTRPGRLVRSQEISNVDISRGDESPEDLVDEPAHTRYQGMLLRMGKVTGCSVWIAANDRSKPYQGGHLGDGSLAMLPNMGLNAEASRRISLIDTIGFGRTPPYAPSKSK